MIRMRVVRLGLILGFAALIPSLFVLLAGQNPWRVLTTLLLYALGPQGWSEVLVHAVPLTLIGLGVAFALRAGLFNIGGDGQLEHDRAVVGLELLDRHLLGLVDQTFGEILQ